MKIARCTVVNIDDEVVCRVLMPDGYECPRVGFCNPKDSSLKVGDEFLWCLSDDVTDLARQVAEARYEAGLRVGEIRGAVVTTVFWLASIVFRMLSPAGN